MLLMNWFHCSHVLGNYSCGLQPDADATAIFLSVHNERVLVFLLYSTHLHYAAHFHIVFHMQHHFVVSFLLKSKSRKNQGRKKWEDQTGKPRVHPSRGILDGVDS